MKNSPTTAIEARDDALMGAALGLARRALGAVWPNPAVGCILADLGDGGAPLVVGRGWTQAGGRPHAETEALARAGGRASGATAYVSLEPCAHHGQTPPCAEALVAAGIARAVIAAEDPDPRVSGRGVERLRRAGIAVRLGVRESEARALNAGFFSRVRRGRPWFALKTATSLDGRIATAAGASRWITGEPARAYGHRLRAAFDAVLIGVGTAAADDPLLTCRLPGMAARGPVRIVMDSRLRLDGESRLAKTAREHPLWIVATETADRGRRQRLEDAGARVIAVPAAGDGRCDPEATAAALGGSGLTRVLIEGGGAIAAAFLKPGLIDRLIWMRAPGLLGGDARPAVAALGLVRPADALRFTRVETRFAGGDAIEIYDRAEAPCSPAS